MTNEQLALYSTLETAVLQETKLLFNVNADITFAHHDDEVGEAQKVFYFCFGIMDAITRNDAVCWICLEGFLNRF